MVFPTFLEDCGLSEESLIKFIESPDDILWQIPKMCSTSKFYCELHNYLKHSQRMKLLNFSKTCIGKFYTKIDPYLSERNFRPDNSYRYINRLVQSVQEESVPDVIHQEQYSTCNDVSVENSILDSCEPPHYNGCPAAAAACRPRVSFKKPSYQPKNVDRREHRNKLRVKSLQCTIKEKDSEIRKLKRLLQKKGRTVQELQEAVDATTLKLDTTALKLDTTQKTSQRKMQKLQKMLDSVLSDWDALEDSSETLQTENEALKSAILTLQNEQETEKIVIVTKNGRYYSPAIRKLYYSLLANQVPAARIREIVSTVLQCFVPDCDSSCIELPKERCAGYMRREELATIGMAQKAHTLCEEIRCGKSFHLNSDGTTKYQHKINGVAVNGLVLSINEISDGSAETIIEDIGKELDKLRETARQLNLPNADSINWTLFSSSSADSASTQKKLNRLLQERRNNDEEEYGPFEDSGIEIIQNFCAMHLGVNLRKAFIHAVSPVDAESSHQYAVVDSFIHAFAKEFGVNGTPEYGAGGIKFPDFLDIRCNDSDDQYYKECVKVRLARQVGSRYFVTAANASKAFYLIPAAIEFLRFNGISDTSGNRLEKELFIQFQDPTILALLKADSLIFYFVYADLTNLAKSNYLNKSAYDMGQHYLELKTYLEEVEKHPEVTQDKNYQVFPSEQRLYCDSAVNPREHHKPVWNRLFQEDGYDDIVLAKLSSGATAMKEKLVVYASSQLPGGAYWDPDPEVKSILSTIKPTNDLCESILGLNDYLTTAIPNMTQFTKSTMVAVKKNKTIKWLQTLPEAQQDDLTLFAMQKRRDVTVAYKEEQIKLKRRRQELMIQAKERRELLEKKAAEERESLSKIHLITSVEELELLFADIDDSEGSAARAIRNWLFLKSRYVSGRK